MPLQPSMAQTRSVNCRPAESISLYPAVSVAYRPPVRTRPVVSMMSMVAERLCGSIPMMTLIIPPVVDIVVSVREGTASSSMGQAPSSATHSLHGTRWEASQ
ncbi:hypothetical protein [Nocardia sp. NPDC051981]|uniref:hypothetical protein n=1 Tax=Nocardia sp. NPDC051981 TaxID=3155417 RepID=UPI00343AC83D